MGKIVQKLHQWELDFHDQDPNEVLKCWRLHLGSCDTLKTVIESLNYKYQDNTDDANSTMTRLRSSEKVPNCIKSLLNGCVWIYKFCSRTLNTFLRAGILYFDIGKDIAFVYIIWNYVDSLTNNVKKHLQI